jgi:UDP-GlcNAc:undecaprenyl-phosphate GlcNAc-1-phosphate transferase
LALGVPIFDTLFSIVRRFLERRPIFSPDRGHLHHRLLDVGLTHRRAVLTLYAVSAIFSATSIAIWLGNQWQGGVALLVSTLVLFALVRFAGYFEYLQRSLLRRSRPWNPTVQSLRGLLPDLPLRLASATADRDLWVHVQRAATAIGCPLVQIRSRGGPEADLLWEHRSPPSDELDLTELAFPLGDGARARAQLLLSLPRADVSSPECEVLLLLFVDMLGRALSNLGSDLAPERGPVVGTQPSLPATCIPASEPTPHG